MRWVLASLALVAAAALFVAGTAWADDGSCPRVNKGNFWAQGCHQGGEYVVEVGISGETPPSYSPGSPPSSGSGGQVPIDCSSIRAPNLSNWWVYNYCNGTAWRPGPSGLLWDCAGLVSLTGGATPLPLTEEQVQDFLQACNLKQQAGSGGQETPPAQCYQEARSKLRPPAPVIGVNPQLGLTGLKSFFWLENYTDDMRLSRTVSVACQIGEWRGVSARIDAWVARYHWSFGDGWGMDSVTPGAPWPEWESEIYHVYERSSLQQPGQKYLVRVWAYWQGSFTVTAERENCTPNAGGGQTCTTERRNFGPYSLGEIAVIGRLPYPVQQAQSVIQAPEE